MWQIELLQHCGRFPRVAVYFSIVRVPHSNQHFARRAFAHATLQWCPPIYMYMRCSHVLSVRCCGALPRCARHDSLVGACQIGRQLFGSGAPSDARVAKRRPAPRRRYRRVPRSYRSYICQKPAGKVAAYASNLTAYTINVTAYAIMMY